MVRLIDKVNLIRTIAAKLGRRVPDDKLVLILKRFSLDNLQAMLKAFPNTIRR